MDAGGVGTFVEKLANPHIFIMTCNLVGYRSRRQQAFIWMATSHIHAHFIHDDNRIGLGLQTAPTVRSFFNIRAWIDESVLKASKCGQFCHAVYHAEVNTWNSQWFVERA